MVKSLQKTYKRASRILLLTQIPLLILFLGFVEFRFHTSIGQSMNSTTTHILTFSILFLFWAIYPLLCALCVLYKQSKFIEKHPDIIKDAWTDDKKLYTLVLYDGDDPIEALRNETFMVVETLSSNPKWGKIAEENKQKRELETTDEAKERAEYERLKAKFENNEE